MKQNLAPLDGVDSKGAGRGSGKGVPGCNPFDTPHGVDKNAAPFSSGKSPKMKAGGRKKRSKGGY